MNIFKVIELELLAILAALMTVKEKSKINIYTDSMGAFQTWTYLFNDEIIWSTRRIFGAVWKTLYRFIKDNKFEVSIFKVKVIQMMWEKTWLMDYVNQRYYRKMINLNVKSI